MRPHLAALFALATAGCLADGTELDRAPMTNGTPAADASTVVALYGTEDMQTTDGRTVAVIVGPASGVLVCPGVVLTAMHVARNLVHDGPLAVSNLPVVWTADEVLVRHRFWPDERFEARVAVPADAHTIPAGARPVLAARTQGEDDGFLFLPIDVPYPSGLSYPTFATSSAWNAGDRAHLYGYGRTGAEAVDEGTRREGFARFDEVQRSKNGWPGLLTFLGRDGGSVAENGDSGGPTFGPVRDGEPEPALAGIHLQSNQWSSFSDLDVGAHAATLGAIRDEMCAAPTPE